MKVAVIDIAGTVDEYSLYLSESLSRFRKSSDEVSLLCQTYQKSSDLKLIKLFSLIPERLKRSVSIWKRSIKAIETILNYLYVIFYIRFNHIDVVHFQWFPFLEIARIEVFVLKIIRRLAPQVIIVYTHHNLYPHDASEIKKKSYKKRFVEISSLIDRFVVHTQTTKYDIQKEFCIDESRISIQYHGIFYPREEYNKTSCSSLKKKILMYGVQSPYKGTDILVNSIGELPDDIKGKLDIEIVGKLSEEYMSTFLSMAETNYIKINPNRIGNKELYEKISAADYLVYPYREISQSGALLLGLYFGKVIITSDLPQFEETLDGFKKDWFFKTGSSASLAELISNHINGNIEENDLLKTVEKLKNQYSWDNVAMSTLEMYDNIMSK